MKALSLWEPWATLMDEKYKRIETRSWSTKHRGELLICAAKVKHPDGFALWSSEQRNGGLPRHLGAWDGLPFGKALCVVNLIDCVPTEWLLRSHEDRASELRTSYFANGGFPQPEERYGNYADGRFAWITEYVTTLPRFPQRGAQGLFTVPDAVVRNALDSKCPDEEARP